MDKLIESHDEFGYPNPALLLLYKASPDIVAENTWRAFKEFVPMSPGGEV
jgi:hypothetical protein